MSHLDVPADVLADVRRRLDDHPRPDAFSALLPATDPTRVDPETGEVLATPTVDELDGPPTLPDAVWESSPRLAAIRQAARARVTSPDAVLGAVLSRLAAQDHRIKLPAITGTPIGLGYFVAAVGAPGAGKSASSKVAAEIVRPRPEIAEANTGSGEGLVEILFEMVPDEEGKPTKRQTRSGCIATVSEGTKMLEVSDRKGSTMLSVLRAAWTDDRIGDANATAERRRTLPPGAYAYGIAIGLQPEKAGPLLADAEAGTPQRFLWVAADDPSAPDTPPPWPENVEWRYSHTPATRGALVNGLAVVMLDVPASVVEEIRATRLAVIRREMALDAMDAHRDLLRLKTAGLLARLDDRTAIAGDDWDTAGLIVDTSTGVRQWVQHRLRSVEERRELDFRDRLAGRAAYVEDNTVLRAMNNATRAVARKVRRVGTASQRDLARAIASRDRQHVTADDAIGRAVALGYLVFANDGTYTAGRVEP